MNWTATRLLVAVAVVFLTACGGGEPDSAAPASDARARALAAPGVNGKIAFSRLLQDGINNHRHIWLVNPDGSGQTELRADMGSLRAEDNNPAWSPNGHRIAFDRFVYGSHTNPQIYVMNADGSGQTRLSGNSSQERNPAWSPDGLQIVFEAGGLHIMQADGTARRRLTLDDDGEPSWSPDGTRIAFRRPDHAHSEDCERASPYSRTMYNIWVVNAAGGGERRVTQFDPASPCEYDDLTPDWSPDGSQILFTRRGYPTSPPSRVGVLVVAQDGTNLRQIAAGFDPAWSPDGTQIVLTRHRGGTVWGHDLYVMNADGTGERRITSPQTNVSSSAPSWQPQPDTTPPPPPPPDTTPPTTPAGLAAAAGNRSVMLSWQSSSDTGGSGLAGYEIWRSASGAQGTFARVATTVATSHTDTGLRRGRTYWYYVVAYDGAGNRSGASSVASATAK